MQLELNPEELKLLICIMEYYMDGLELNTTEKDYLEVQKLFWKVERVS